MGSGVTSAALQDPSLVETPFSTQLGPSPAGLVFSWMSHCVVTRKGTSRGWVDLGSTHNLLLQVHAEVIPFERTLKQSV